MLPPFSISGPFAGRFQIHLDLGHPASLIISTFILWTRILAKKLSAHTVNDVYRERKPQMVLPSSKNAYGDVEVTTVRLPRALKTKFAAELVQSMQQWRAIGVGRALFRISLEDASLVSILAQNGFEYHEVKPKELTMAQRFYHAPSGQLVSTPAGLMIATPVATNSGLYGNVRNFPSNASDNASAAEQFVCMTETSKQYVNIQQR